MPGPYYLCSYYFVTKDNEGWSENFYLQSADISSAATSASQYILPRTALSPDNVDLVYAKVSDVDIRGDSKIALPLSGSFPYAGTYVADPVGSYLEANTAMLIELIGSPSKKNRFFLRGLSLDVVTGREYKAPAAFDTALTALTTFIVGRFLVRTQVQPTTVPPTYNYDACTDAFFTKVSARKPGRPFSMPRGRKFAHRAASARVAKSSTLSAPDTKPSSVSPPVRRR